MEHALFLDRIATLTTGFTPVIDSIYTASDYRFLDLSVTNKILEEVDISNTDNFIAVTNDDEVNILSSLLAKRAGAKNCMTLINNSSYSSLLNNIGKII